MEYSTDNPTNKNQLSNQMPDIFTENNSSYGYVHCKKDLLDLLKLFIKHFVVKKSKKYHILDQEDQERKRVLLEGSLTYLNDKDDE